MRRDELRDRLDAELGIESSEEAERLCSEIDEYDRFLIPNALTGGRDEWSDLLTEARRVRRSMRSNKGLRRIPGRAANRERELGFGLTDRDRWRAEAMTSAIARDAASRPRVRSFRDRVLGGTLTSEQAWAFMASPALTVLSVEECEIAGIPFVGHVAKYESAVMLKPDRSHWRVTMSVDPPGCVVHKELPGDDLAVRVELRLPTGGRPGVSAYPGSIIADLCEIGDWLDDALPWEWGEATWFVLTGQPPEVLPLRGHLRLIGDDSRGPELYRRAVVRLDVEPWVSVESVMAAYRTAQRALLGNKDNRPIAGKTLEAFRWVEEQLQGPDGKPSLRELCRQWNKRPDISDDWKYPLGREDDFGETYHRTRKALMTPTYRSPEDVGTTGRRTPDSKVDSKARGLRRTSTDGTDPKP